MREGYITHVIVTDTKLDGLAYQQLHPETRDASALYVDANGGWLEPPAITRDPKALEQDAQGYSDLLGQALRDVQKHNLAVFNDPDEPYITLENAILPSLMVTCAFENTELGRARHQASVEHPDLEFYSVASVRRDAPTMGNSWTDVVEKGEREFIVEASKMMEANGIQPRRDELAEEWRGTITEAISEAGKRPGVVGFVNADWASQSRLRVETSQQLAESIEEVRTLIAPESEARRVYTVGGDGTIRNTVTDREEYVAVSAEALKARPELGAALEKQAAMEVGIGARELAVEAPDMDVG